MNASRVHRYATPAVLLSAGLVLRLAAIPIVGDSEIPYEWGTLTRSLISGQGYSYFFASPAGSVGVSASAPNAVALPSAYMPPLYAFVMAGLLRLFGSESHAAVAAGVIQSFLSVATALLVYLSARLLGSDRQAKWALGLYALFPLGIYASAQVSSVVLYVLLGQLAIYLLLDWRFGNHPGRLHLVGAGLASGVLLLTRGEAAATTAIFAVWVLVAGHSPSTNSARERFRARVANTAWYLFPAVLVAMPWAIRNFVVFGGPTALTVSGGYNLWQGQNVMATGIHGGSVSPPVTEPRALQDLIASLPATNTYELARDNLYLREALGAMASDPGRSVLLAARKGLMYWTNLYFGVPIEYPGAQSPLVVVPWLAIVALAVIGLWVGRRSWRRISLLHAYLSINTLLVMLFFVMPRYNLAILPCVAILAGQGAAGLVRSRQGMAAAAAAIPVPRVSRPPQ